MLILPTEKRFDWRYTPWMLCTLVLLNVLIFFVYQSKDAHKFEQAYERYVELDLVTKEWPAFSTYLKEQQRDDELADYEAMREDGFEDELAFSILSERAFYPWLSHRSDLLTFDVYDANDSWESWRRQREQINALMDAISVYAAGLTPAQIEPWTLLSYQFLHGDFMHLLGNMIFLVFCGFAVEAAIGAWLFLALYLCAGVASGLLFALLDLESLRPLVGASGSISGVMAMYLGIFRLRRIEFFYWIFIFAGYFRAPALLILPLYIGKEVLNHFTQGDSNVAFMAHAGGFVCGGLLVLGLYYWRPQLFNEHYIEENQDIDPERDARARIYEQMDAGQFAKVIDSIAQHQKHFGADFELAALAYQLARATAHPQAQTALRQLLTLKPHDAQQLTQLARACAQEPELLNWLPPAEAMKLALQLSVPEHLHLAEQFFGHYFKQNEHDPALAILARKLALTFEQLKQLDKRNFYEGIADRHIRGAF